eukprot:TRINITY_DN67251_c10_g3_i1.p1 TRINITY_DN67251_c10_g3~~TRINITY_DN67251_c10_g3_i1.p1  ORF type:complete len:383 (-),score=17.69 TRINITY_DN67251_c10_g3_i1:407-1555(-)
MDFRLFFLLFLVPATAKRFLPDGPLIIAYANWNECDEKMIRAAENGANVLMWFSIDLGAINGTATIVGHIPNLTCVAEVALELRKRNLPTTHMISIGGWDSPHPVTSPKLSGRQWWEVWEKWNREQVAHPRLGFPGFDGFDWDLEGDDDPASPTNHFSMDTLDIMGEMSTHAKRAGYLVSMVPPQSYLDSTTSKFNRSLLLAYPSYHPDFHWHGMNCYGYVLAKYKQTTLPSTEHEEQTVTPTFDFVSIQLYESWSRANYYIEKVGMPVAKYLVELVRQMQRGWVINFQDDPKTGMPSQMVQVHATQVVLGLANGWTGPDRKALLLWPKDLKEAYESLADKEKPRGFAFWDIGDEGRVPQGTSQPLWLASSLNKFLHIRKKQ